MSLALEARCALPHAGRPAMVGARVSREVRTLFEHRGARAGASAGEVLELVGRALLQGMTIAQLRDRLGAADNAG